MFTMQRLRSVFLSRMPTLSSSARETSAALAVVVPVVRMPSKHAPKLALSHAPTASQSEFVRPPMATICAALATFSGASLSSLRN